MAFRLRAQDMKSLLQPAGLALAMLLRYTQAMIAHVAQTALCNRYHSIDQQLCRRLLLGLDRSSSDELAMTQEGAADLLGVRREGVTAAALKLQHAGVIRYRRGHIGVLDRDTAGTTRLRVLCLGQEGARAAAAPDRAAKAARRCPLLVVASLAG